MQDQGNGGDVRNRIPGSYLMEMDILHGLSVNISFCFGDGGIDCCDMLLHRIIQRKGFYHLADLTEGTVGMMMVVVVVMVFVVMVMLMIVGFFLISMDQDPHLCTGDPAFLCGFVMIFHIGDTKVVQLIDHSLRVREKGEKGSSQHISRSSHATVYI